MSLRDLEREIVEEAKKVRGNEKVKLKNIVEWQTGHDLKCQEGEEYIYLPKLVISVCLKAKLVEE